MSTTKKVIFLLAQIGMLTRRELGIALSSLGEGPKPEVKNFSNQISKAVKNLERKGLIETYSENGKNYLALTKEGKKTAEELKLPKAPWLEGRWLRNAKEKKHVASNALCLFATMSMGITALAYDKPEYSAFVNCLSMKSKSVPIGNLPLGIDRPGLIEMLNNGICYNIAEIRSAFLNSGDKSMAASTTRRIGMIFTKEQIITLYYLWKKESVLVPKAEKEFDRKIWDQVEKSYSWLGMRVPKKTAFVLVSSISIMPSFFHGTVDGLSTGKKLKEKENRKGYVKVSFKEEKLPQYQQIFLLPAAAADEEYRRNLYRFTIGAVSDNYSDKEQLRDEKHLLVCRYPEFHQFRNIYNAPYTTTIVGPGDPVLADLISRCLRTKMEKYIDMETLLEMRIARYDDHGYPVGDSKNNTEGKSSIRICHKLNHKLQ